MWRPRQIFNVATYALNTVAACDTAGGARRLFDEMTREPQGPTAQRYKRLDFATELLRHAAPDPMAPEAEEGTGWSIARAIVLQVLAGLVASGCALLLMRLAPLVGFQPTALEGLEQLGEAALRDPALASALEEAGVDIGEK